MTREEAVVGTRVRALRAWIDVPQGTEGVIDEDGNTGVMVAWDLPDNPLPASYAVHDGAQEVVTGILRFYFEKKLMNYLEAVKIRLR